MENFLESFLASGCFWGFLVDGSLWGLIALIMILCKRHNSFGSNLGIGLLVCLGIIAAFMIIAIIIWFFICLIKIAFFITCGIILVLMLIICALLPRYKLL